MNGSTIPAHVPTPNAKLAALGYQIDLPDGGKSCIVLQSGPTHSLVAKLLQCSSLAVYTTFVQQAKNARNEATDACVRTFDAGCCAPEAHQNDQSYVRELSGPIYFRFITKEFSMEGGYTEDLINPQNCQNWGVGACPYILQPEWFWLLLHKVVYTVNKVAFRKHHFSTSCSL